MKEETVERSCGSKDDESGGVSAQSSGWMRAGQMKRRKTKPPRTVHAVMESGKTWSVLSKTKRRTREMTSGKYVAAAADDSRSRLERSKRS